MRVVSIVALLTLFSATARAQTIETPVPFDSAHRVLAVTPAMAERLRLSAPAWPVTGVFREARLYSVTPGDGFTLVVHRASGSLERFTFSTSERIALGSLIDAAMATAGRPSGEQATDMVSEPAGNAFARRLTILSGIVYGPLAASLADGGSGAGALYLLTTGLTYFISYGSAQSTPFTRAQSDLAGDLGLASGAAAMLGGYALTGNADKGVRAAALGGALVGTIAGVGLGAKMSDAEAHGAIMGIEAGAAAGVTAVSLAGAEGQATAIAAVVGGALGYPLGVLFPRRAGYTVTAGDVESIGTSALIGAGWAAATLGGDPGPARVGATLGAGYLAGAVAGERLLARSFNFTQSQANVLKVGAVAGGLLGLALPVLSDQDDLPIIATAVAAGATLGVAALAGSFPRTSRAGAEATRSPGGSASRLRMTFSPAGALAAASGAVGRHSLVRFTF